MSVDYGEKHVSARAKLFALMQDCQWHSWRELQAVAGNRYGARLLELRRLGYRFADPEPEGEDGQRYRLLSIHPDRPQLKRVKILMDEKEVIALLRGDMSLFARQAIVDALKSYQHNKAKL